MKLNKISVFLLVTITLIVGRGVFVSVKNYSHPQNKAIINALGPKVKMQENKNFTYKMPQTYSDLFEDVNPYEELTKFPVYRSFSHISTNNRSASYPYMSRMDSISRRVVRSPAPLQLFSSTSVMLPYCATSIETAAASITMQSVNTSSSGRRNLPGDPEDPFLEPVGDMPWELVLLLLAGYVWYRRR